MTQDLSTMANILPLLDNATCSILLLVVLWRFDATVRHMAEMQRRLIDRMLQIIGESIENDDT